MDENERAVELLDRLGRIAHGLQFSMSLNPAQWEALRFLARANGYSRSPGALADFLGTTKGTASQTLIALESKGLIKRSRRASDRRSVDLEVTAAGREMISKDPMKLVGQAASALDRDACATMNTALGQLVESLQRTIGLPEFGPCFDCVHFREEPAVAETPSACHCDLRQEMLSRDGLGRMCASFESLV